MTTSSSYTPRQRGRKKFTTIDLLTRKPYSDVLDFLIALNRLGESATVYELTKKGIKNTLDKRKSLDRTRIYRILQRLVEEGLVEKEGGSYKISFRNASLARELSERILSSRPLSCERPGVILTHSAEFSKKLKQQFYETAVEAKKRLDSNWTNFALDSLERELRDLIMKMEREHYTAREMAYALIDFNRRLKAHLIQLGWFNEDETPNEDVLIKLDSKKAVEALVIRYGLFIIRDKFQRNAIRKHLHRIRRTIDGGPRTNDNREQRFDKEKAKNIGLWVEKALTPIQVISEPTVIIQVSIPTARDLLV